MTIFRVIFGWSNFKDFDSRAEADRFVQSWVRPVAWVDALLLDPKIIELDRTEGR